MPTSARELPSSATPATARSRGRQAFRALAALWLLLGLVATVAPAAAAAQTDARFSGASAEADFPERMTLRITAEAEADIERVELFWRPVGDEVLSAAYPEFTPGARVEIEHDVDMTIAYLPPGVDITWFCRVTDANGNITDSPDQTLFYMDEARDWQTKTDRLVSLWWYAGNDSFADSILSAANRAIDRLAVSFDVTADEPIRIVVYGDERDFADALPPNSAEWIGGQAHPGLNLFVAAIQPGGGSESEIGRMVPHEVSHLILHQATENPWNTPPNWLDEGLAVYNQETEDTRLSRQVEDAIEEGRLIPVRALNSSFPLDADQALLSYGESESIVRYIVEQLGEEQLAALIAIFREEVSYDEAVERALGITVEELDAGWKAWLGYTGDTPPSGLAVDPAQPSNQTRDDEDDDLSQNELIFVLSCMGLLALAGLALGIVSVFKLRDMR